MATPWFRLGKSKSHHGWTMAGWPMAGWSMAGRPMRLAEFERMDELTIGDTVTLYYDDNSYTEGQLVNNLARFIDRDKEPIFIESSKTDKTLGNSQTQKLTVHQLSNEISNLRFRKDITFFYRSYI